MSEKPKEPVKGGTATPDTKINPEVPAGWDQLDDDFGDPWSPEREGDSIRGTFLGIAYVPNPGGSFITHRIKTEQGIKSVASAILERKMERIPDGTDVMLVYTGMVQMKTNASRKSRGFDVFYPRNTKLRPVRPIRDDTADEYTR